MNIRTMGLAATLSFMLPFAIKAYSNDQGIVEYLPSVEEVNHTATVVSPENQKMDDIAANTSSTTYDIDQINKTFSQSSLTVKVGDEINFVNSDSYFHNIYSLSEPAQFDLGSYPKGESRSITLEKPGEVVARCAIHPQMRLDITVVDK